MNTYNNQQVPSMMTNNFVNEPSTLSTPNRNSQKKKTSIKKKWMVKLLISVGFVTKKN